VNGKNWKLKNLGWTEKKHVRESGALATFTIAGTTLNLAEFECSLQHTQVTVQKKHFTKFGHSRFFMFIQIGYMNLTDSAIFHDSHHWCLPTKALHHLHPFTHVNKQ
jgi:hypothetical protein